MVFQKMESTIVRSEISQFILTYLLRCPRARACERRGGHAAGPARVIHRRNLVAGSSELVGSWTFFPLQTRCVPGGPPARGATNLLRTQVRALRLSCPSASSREQRTGRFRRSRPGRSWRDVPFSRITSWTVRRKMDASSRVLLWVVVSPSQISRSKNRRNSEDCAHHLWRPDSPEEPSDPAFDEFPRNDEGFLCDGKGDDISIHRIVPGD